MQVLIIIFNVLLVIDALALVVAVLMQQGQTANLGAISGGAETFFGKNKARSYEGKLSMITKITASVFIVLAIATTAMTARLHPTVSADTYPTEYEEEGEYAPAIDPVLQDPEPEVTGESVD